MKTMSERMGESAAVAGGMPGRALNRVDGRQKVTGAARYSAEIAVDGIAYGYVVSGAIARGRIKAIHTDEALAVPGVAHIITHKNRPRLAWLDRNYRDKDAPPGAPFRPLRDDVIVYSGQPVALVLADSFESARHAASLVRVDYMEWRHETSLEAQKHKAYTPKKSKDGFDMPEPRGDFGQAYAGAALTLEAEYSHQAQHHNPMEMHASTVIVEADGGLTIYDKTQGPQNSQQYVSRVFGLPMEKVHIKSSFVGGAFGSGLRPQYQLFLAVLAALELKRSVKVVLTRQQMFSFGHRPETRQTLKLGASNDGTLQALRHDALSETSQFEDYTENLVNWSGMLYHCDNAEFSHRLARLDVYTPLDMRAPGGVTGCYAIECAMDELAYLAGIDPLELRLKNYSHRDQNHDLPYSSKELRECYRQGAALFGWSRRTAAPRSMRDGRQLIGWGMATGIWEAMHQPAQAHAVLGADGKLSVGSATQDIGTGTYTVMTQIAAATLGLPVDDVSFVLGDSSLPQAPLQGGSFTVASVGTAVQGACQKLGKKLLQLARNVPQSPLSGVIFDDVEFVNGSVRLKSDVTRAVSLVEAMRYADLASIEDSSTGLPSPKRLKSACATHSAVFAEVRVDEDLGTVKVTRVVSAVAAGRIL
ncbi:MAG TPA: xanthine dehydrogenase family protein molybdopterin-binding subunit, partial [Janthinobacterium sp.]|nr:xanthine dehydrogenase family protein molybdopterin-binding subunit [Janthinobacterium sp.]